MTVCRSWRLCGRVVLWNLVVALSCLGGCGMGEDNAGWTEVGHQARPLVNGVDEPGHAAVGLVSHGQSLCTGTLVGKKTVLTAAHCIEPGETHYFLAGDIDRARCDSYQATAVHPHPNYEPVFSDNDVAVLLLADAPPITPASISTVAPTVGQELTLVGYGSLSADATDYGRRRTGKNEVDSLLGNRLIVAGAADGRATICDGDSGGPSFATINGHEVQVGVHSTVLFGGCGGQSHDMRVDLYQDWIRQTAGGDLAEDGKPSPVGDSEPPLVKILAPADRSEVPFRFTVEAEVTDNEGVARVGLWVDDQPAAQREQAPFDFPLEIEDGQVHQLMVRALDPSGNEGQASVMVKVRPPDGTSDAGPSDPAEDGAAQDPTGQHEDPTSEADASPPSSSGGCALGGPSPDPGLALLLLVAGATLVFRRRHPPR